MSSKSTKNKIKEYSSVAETVKKVDKKPEEKKEEKVEKTQVKSEPKPVEQEEPRITEEQVIEAFRSFGFEPNEKNNDIGYWTTRGQSEGQKLMEELYNKKNELNNEEESTKKTKETLPRLNDEDISALFDEYGLPQPDPEWARNHLPNDPIKLRSILEMQRKMTDDAVKEEATNSMSTPPQNIQPQPATPIPGMPTGMGGPIEGEPGMMPGSPTSNPFFIGDHSIVRITQPNNPNSSTTWLVDTKKKVLRPFMSDEAFKNAFENPAEAEKSVVTISAQELGPGGVLEGFSPLQGGKGVQGDGSMEDIEFSPAQIQRRYGKESDETSENKALSMLDGVFGNLNNQQ